MEEDVQKTKQLRLYKEIKETQWPIVYGPDYNIKFYGMEKLHPFDAGKWGRIYEFLKEAGMIYDETTVRPEEASREELLFVHTERYINSLKLADFIEGIHNFREWSAKVAGITEVPPVALLPNFIVQRTVLKPFRFHTGGTILAAWLALQRGWAINIGGGFHHCSAERGGGFCAYADITLALRYAMAGYTACPPSASTTSASVAPPASSSAASCSIAPPASSSSSSATLKASTGNGAANADAVDLENAEEAAVGGVEEAASSSDSLPPMRRVRNAMIVDLDAHQGNGHERDFMGAENVYILDVYNRDIYPHDGYAKRAIKRKVELTSYTEDAQYLRLVETHLEGALNEFTPDLIVYNAGTDILRNDPLGCLSISPAGIIERDEIVFTKARSRNIPIVMVTSGGYDKSTARIIADSILNLRDKGLIPCEGAANYKPPPAPPQSSLPRCRSEGGIWAKFKNCANMSRSSTSEHLSSASPCPALPRSQTTDARLHRLSSSSSSSSQSQSRSLGSRGSRLQGSGSSIGIARSRTQEDIRRLEEKEDEDDFMEEELDFRSMLEAGLKGAGPKGAGPKRAGPKGAESKWADPKGAGSKGEGPKGVGPKGVGPIGEGSKVESQNAGLKGEGSKVRSQSAVQKETSPKEVGSNEAGSKEKGPMEVRPKEAQSKELGPEKTHVEDNANQSGYESSPYDSDDSDGIIDPKDTIYNIECPSYEDFVKSKESLNTEVKVSNVGEELPEEFQGISA